MSHLNKIEEFQSEFKKRLNVVSSPEDISIPSFFVSLLESSDDLIEFSFGKLGLKLKSLFKTIDISHPEILSFLDKISKDQKDFADKCFELLKLAEYAKSNGLLKIIPEIGQQIIRANLSKQMLKELDAINNNRMYVRLLVDSDMRQQIRMTKRMQTIDLSLIYKKGDEVWISLPDSFEKFLRFESAYKDEIEKAERKAQRYLQLGCSSLAKEINKSIEDFREHVNHSYFGFNRVTMTNASVILAKSLNFNFVAETDIVHANYGVLKKNGTITVPRNFFSNFDLNSSDFHYEPRVYPYHELFDLASEDTKKTIEVLESFPEAGFKPIFDHFGIIVPSIKFPHLKQKLYTFLDENGILQSYNEREDAIRSLDRMLIRENHFRPIILGERDGKCYFICYL